MHIINFIFQNLTWLLSQTIIWTQIDIIIFVLIIMRQKYHVLQDIGNHSFPRISFLYYLWNVMYSWERTISFFLNINVWITRHVLLIQQSVLEYCYYALESLHNSDDKAYSISNFWPSTYSARIVFQTFRRLFELKNTDTCR